MYIIDLLNSRNFAAVIFTLPALALASHTCKVWMLHDHTISLVFSFNVAKKQKDFLPKF